MFKPRKYVNRARFDGIEIELVVGLDGDGEFFGRILVSSPLLAALNAEGGILFNRDDR